jgi:peptide/nickel transport system substrate-binding protein
MLAMALSSSCGSSTTHVSTVTLLMSRAPGSLDPGVASRAEAIEADWLVYTPLLTFAHSPGVTGTRLIPGLATDLPRITDGGTTYRFTLRKRLVYSNGEPVRASDFKWAVERAIRLGWPGAGRFILARIVGASAFAGGRAPSISGITADDATGQVTIRLIAADGGFDDVLAMPALAPVPGSTAVRDERSAPPPGVGPYEISSVTPGRSFSLVRNPRWPLMAIPGIPVGHLDVEVTVSPDATANVLAVLGERADVLDVDNPIPPSLLRPVDFRARRLPAQTIDATDTIVLNASSAPFTSRLVREAVVVALDRQAIERLARPALDPGCYLLPPPMVGHPSARCPYRHLAGSGEIARARALVARSGWAGARVTVWSSAGSQLGPFTRYYVSLLDQIGFRATEKPVAKVDAPVHSSNAPPQTDVALLAPDLPDPAAVYAQLVGAAATPRGWVGTRYVDAQLRLLGTVPAGQLSAVAGNWRALDEYTAKAAYVAVLGYPTVSELFSTRIDSSAAVFQPVVGLDWSSLMLK